MPFQTAAEAKQLIKKHAMHVASCFLSTNAAPIQLTAEIHRSLKSTACLGQRRFLSALFDIAIQIQYNALRFIWELILDASTSYPESLQRNYSPVKSKQFSRQQLGHSFMATCSSSSHHC